MTVVSSELKEALLRHTLALFIGADLPSVVTGVPSRADLARELLCQPGLDGSLPLYEVTQRVRQACNPWEVTHFIRNAFDTVGKPPKPFHQCIVKVVNAHQIKTLITTAYDNLLELAFKEAHMDINLVIRDDNLEYVEPNCPTLIKLYGDAQQPNTLVVTEDHHFGLSQNRDKQHLLDEVRAVLNKNAILFLGHDLGCPDFGLLWQCVLKRPGRFGLRAWAVWPSLPENHEQRWQSRGIRIIREEPLAFLESIMAVRSDKSTESLSEVLPKLAGQSNSLADVLIVYPDKQGSPHKPGPAQWFSRLIVESQRSIRACEGRIHSILQLSDPSDRSGAYLPDFHESRLSWGSRANGLFAPISVRPGPIEYLDLAWRARGDPQIPADALLVASALDQGGRDARSPSWGTRQDFMRLKPGYYLFVVRIMAEGYDPLERTYQLYWPGPGQEDDIRLAEVTDSVPIRGQALRSFTQTSPTVIRNRYALLIGVRDYWNPAYCSLPHTVHDVKQLDKVLRGADYTVRTLHSDQTTPRLKPTRANIWESLQSIASQTGPGDLLVIYFGGHGDLRENVAYLIPCDGGKSSLRRTAVNLDDFRETLSAAGAQAKVLILDACHSGIGRDVSGMDAEFERHLYLEAAGTATLAACRRGEVAHEHDGSPHGAFTYYLLEGLEGAAARESSSFISFRDLSDYVTYTVKQWSIRQGLQQWPNTTTQLVGDPPLIELQRVG